MTESESSPAEAQMKNARSQLARLIDHTQVRAYATQTDIDELCAEAAEWGFATVTVNTAWTSYCVKRLENINVAVCSTIAFPLGASTAHMKVEEAREATGNGADELDMVVNIGALKSGYPSFVEEEIETVVTAAANTPVKIVIETPYLSDTEKVAICEMCVRAGAAFVQTCTGFAKAGATADDVRLLRQASGGNIGIKAAGGVRTYRDTVALFEAGASRIGTSHSVQIVEEMPPE
jgi:deoxyribose-phosphate aldolase